jgi:hypothetical protein
VVTGKKFGEKAIFCDSDLLTIAAAKKENYLFAFAPLTNE